MDGGKTKENRKKEQGKSAGRMLLIRKRVRRLLASYGKRSVPEEALNNAVLIGIGTLSMAAAYSFFYSPNGIAPGGFTGLAMAIRRLTEGIVPGGIPLWAGSLLLNIPLLIVAWILRGWRFIRRTILASALFSMWLAILPEHAIVKDDLLLNAIFGGIAAGFGLGAAFLGKATTGGTDTLAAVLQKKLPWMNTAAITPVMDGIVILISARLFGIRASAYALLSIIILGQVAGRVMSGFRNACAAYIISDRHEEIAVAVMKRMHRGATAVPATGMYTRENRTALVCAVSKKQIAELKEIAYETDPDAFMIIADAREIRGAGFLRYSEEEL